MKTVAAAAFATTLSFLCLPALADKVPPPPPDCIEGSSPKTGHGGPYCDPKDCEADADCKDGTACQERALCVADFTGGGRRPRDVPAPKYKSMLAPCDKADGSACSLPAEAANRYWGKKEGTCQSLKICVAASAAATPPKSTAKPSAEPAATPAGQPDPKRPSQSDDKPASATDKPPCSCAGANGELTFSTVGLVFLWLLVLWRGRD
ncbi:MAG: hypothetical protein JRI68_13325 [Deltaproteobacteria bacterium]|nr:hypothetical protein [Deltaproteobacteria bacterium]